MKKKTLIAGLLSLFFIPILSAQKITYREKGGKPTKKSKAAYYSQVSKVGKSFKYEEYLMDGSINVTGFSSKKDGSVKQGEWIWFFKNYHLQANQAIDSSQIKALVHFIDNQKQGEVLQYYNPGNLKSEEYFEHDQLQSAKYYYKSGNIKSEVLNVDGTPLKRVDYYENGQIKNDISYQAKDQELYLKVLAYYEDGQLKRNELYKSPYADKLKLPQYNLVNGACYNHEGQIIEDIPFMRNASFPGGKEALIEFVTANLEYPSDAMQIGIKGKAVVSFYVNKDGLISRPRIVQSDYRSFSEEALRIANLIPYFIPAIDCGELVGATMSFPVFFN